MFAQVDTCVGKIGVELEVACVVEVSRQTQIFLEHRPVQQMRGGKPDSDDEIAGRHSFPSSHVTT
jgi:hypothetical protein